MIKQITDNIKKEAVESGNNLTMDLKTYKEYLFERTQIILKEKNIDILISEFDNLSDNVLLNDLEPVNINLEDMTVKEFIKGFKFSLLAGFIVHDIVKMTYREVINNIIN